MVPGWQEQPRGEQRVGRLASDCRVDVGSGFCLLAGRPLVRVAQTWEFAGPGGKLTDTRSKDLVGTVQTMLPTSPGSWARHFTSLTPCFFSPRRFELF